MSARVSRMALVAALIGLGSAVPNQYGQYDSNTSQPPPSYSSPSSTLKPTSSVPPHPYVPSGATSTPPAYATGGSPPYVPSGVSGVKSYPMGSPSAPGVSYTPITQTVTLTTTVPCKPYTSSGNVYSSTASYITTTMIDYLPSTSPTLEATSTVPPTTTPGGGSPYQPESVSSLGPTSVPGGGCVPTTVTVTAGGGGDVTKTETVTVTVTPPSETLPTSSVPGGCGSGSGSPCYPSSPPYGTGAGPSSPMGTGTGAGPYPTGHFSFPGGPGPVIPPSHSSSLEATSTVPHGGYGASSPTLIPTFHASPPAGYSSPVSLPTNKHTYPVPVPAVPSVPTHGGYGGPESVSSVKPTYSKPPTYTKPPSYYGSN